MSKSTRISRRTVLRGLGTAVALPWLEASLPRVAFGADAPTPPVRMAFLCVPNGAHMPDWTPDKAGTDFELKPTLQPIAKFKSEMLQLSGLALDGGRAHGDGPGDHARSCASFLTGAHPKKTHGADIYNGISVDQLAAEKIGHHTRFPSLELGIERGAQSGNCDSGYSCAYSANLAWRTPTSPVAKEIDPVAVIYLAPLQGLFRTAPLNAEELKRGQSASFYPQGGEWQQAGPVPAIVAEVSSFDDNQSRVELALRPEGRLPAPLKEGQAGRVEIELERVSPATLVFRAGGLNNDAAK